MLSYFLAASSPESALLTYGPLGIFVVISMGGIIAMWRRQEKIYDENIKAERANTAEERARGNRLETELLNLNRLISSELSGHLVRSTEAVREATDVVRRRDR